MSHGAGCNGVEEKRPFRSSDVAMLLSNADPSMGEQLSTANAGFYAGNLQRYFDARTIRQRHRVFTHDQSGVS
jgi:hypothetical protein